MGRKPLLDDYILKELYNEPYTGEELKKRVINQLDANMVPQRTKHTFDESIMRLMKKGDVQVIGFVHPEKRGQNLKSDYLVFSLTKTDPIELLHSFNEMDNNNNKVLVHSEDISGDNGINRSVFNLLDKPNIRKSKDAKNKLKNIFLNRIKNIDSDKMKRWKTAKDSLDFKLLTDDELIWIEAFWMLYRNFNDISQGNTLYKEPEGFSLIGFYLDKAKDNLSELAGKYKYLKIRYLPDEKFIMPIKDLYEAEEFIRYNLTYDSDDEKQIRNWQIKEQGLEEFSDELLDIYFDYSFQPVANEEFIERRLGFGKPKKLSLGEIEKLFEDLLLYINSKDSGQNALKIKLVRGLSGMKDADKVLEGLIAEVTDNKVII